MVLPKGEVCAEEEDQMAGNAVDAESNTVFFKNERRDLLLEFIITTN
jgi:hypothetical protein